ncbi:MAG: WG repeat-containing protein [Candidatus Omnitrophica bacterium]|nr:WG repeat-containing protein [Candidatus Omnitrophota bacterium]
MSTWIVTSLVVGSTLCGAQTMYRDTVHATTTAEPLLTQDLPIRSPTSERFLVLQGDHFGYVNTAGTMVIGPLFDMAWEFSEGLARVGWHGKIGYIDRTGRFFIPPKFDWAQQFRRGLAYVGTASNAGYIDKAGRYVWRRDADPMARFAQLSEAAWRFTR